MDSERKIMQFFIINQDAAQVHYHQHIELFYLLKGKIEIRIDDQVYALEKGDFLIINANKRHYFQNATNILGARFEINFRILSEIMGTMQLFFWCNTVVDKNNAYDKCRQLMDRILEHYYEKDNSNALFLNSLYYQLLSELTSNFLVRADDRRLDIKDSSDRVRIRQIQNYIQSNYQNQISLNDLADRLFLSNAYLSKYIKKCMGMTFMEYLNNIRLFHAIDELLYTEKNLTRIALDNGFPTSASFTKVFRAAYHEAPSEYRKRMKSQLGFEQADETASLKSEETIMEFLKLKENSDLPEAGSIILRTVDAREFKKRAEIKNSALNVGNVFMFLQSEVQKQMLEIKRKTGVKYIRVWNALSRKDSFDEKGKCNFHKLDLALDFLVENQMVPYIEIGNKPSLIMATPEQVVKKYDQQEIFTLEQFKKVVRKLCLHLVNRYGVEEIEKWYFEFWDDPRLEMEKKDGLYYQYFDILYCIMKEISEEIKVGGSGFVLGYEFVRYKKIFQIWKEKEIHPDFISFGSFQYVCIIENGNQYGRKSIDPNYMSNQVELTKQMMKEVGFFIPEFHIDEWNHTISNQNIINDSCEQGAYMMKTYIEMEGKVDFMAYWHALDYYSDFYEDGKILNGDSGIISQNGICKPSFYALVFWNKLLKKEIFRDEHSIVTTNGRNQYVIACHNFKKLAPSYVFEQENEIKVDELMNYMEDMDTLHLQYRIENVKEGNYQVKIYYVNRNHGSMQDIWKKLDYTGNLANEELEYMKKSAQPYMEIHNIYVKNGILELDSILDACEIRLLDIQYRYKL